ncbi:MAG: type II toxin-antitoxin system HicB family antitoxin [Candidatus Thermoplasmatota archaeon]
MDLKFRVQIDHDAEDGLYYAQCLDLQGCHTFGENRAEALDRIQEVILDHLQARFHINQMKQLSKSDASEVVEIAA